MKLQIHSIRFDADQKLLDFVQKKADKLDTFFDRITGGEVYLRLDNSESRDNKVVEIKILVPGDSFFAKEQSGSFEAATDEAVESLRRQLRRYKDKMSVKKGVEIPETEAEAEAEEEI